MIPILYKAKTTDFSTQGLGPLADTIAYTVSFDGSLSELSITYPRNGIHFSEIVPGAIIKAKPNHWQDPQPFVILGETKGTEKTATFKARHTCHLADGWPVSPFTAYSAKQAVTRAAENLMVSGCPYTLYTDINKNDVLEVKTPTTLRGAAQQLQKRFGGEVVYNGTQTRILASAGADRGVVIRYGVDLIQAQQERNIANMVTGIVPYFSSKSTDGATVWGDALTASGTFPFTRIVPVDLTDQFDQTPTKAQLNAAGRVYIAENDIGVPEVNLSLSYADLGQDVRNYDTVTVDFTELGVTATAKVCKLNYDGLNEKNIGVEVGSAKKTIVDTIAEGRRAIHEVPTTTAMQQAILDQTELITGIRGGYIVYHYNASGQPSEILIMDADTEAQAQKVLRINNLGIGFSTNGVNGPFETAWTINGQFNAKWITAGYLNVDRIEAKTIKTEKLDDGSVTTAKIGDLAVSTGKIAGSAVTYGKTGFQGTLDQVGTNKQDISTLYSYVRAHDTYINNMGGGIATSTLNVSQSFAFQGWWAQWKTIKDGDGNNQKVLCVIPTN